LPSSKKNLIYKRQLASSLPFKRFSKLRQLPQSKLINMSSILNVLRQAPTPTRHFTSLQIVSSVKGSSSPAAFNPEHHPIVLQQLVESLSPNSFITPATTGSNSAVVRESFSGNVAAASQGSQVQASKIAQ
ncbi:hypothetical protein BGZ90_011839, partial [Linnemannia elongata]